MKREIEGGIITIPARSWVFLLPGEPAKYVTLLPTNLCDAKFPHEPEPVICEGFVRCYFCAARKPLSAVSWEEVGSSEEDA